MAKHLREYQLPNGSLTHSETRYFAQWHGFAGLAAKYIKLKIKGANSSNCTFYNEFKKSNQKYVTNKSISIPNWFTYQIILGFRRKDAEIEKLKKENELLMKYISKNIKGDNH